MVFENKYINRYLVYVFEGLGLYVLLLAVLYILSSYISEWMCIPGRNFDFIPFSNHFEIRDVVKNWDFER